MKQISLTHKILFALCIALQIILIGTVFGVRYYTRINGAAVVVHASQYDPRDLIRGDYLLLSYDIGMMNKYQIDNGLDVKPGDVVYVSLEKSSYTNYWQVRRVSHAPPQDFPVFLKGTVASVDPGNNVRVVYDIERYYIPAGTGLDYRSETGYEVALRVDRSGSAIIESLKKDGSNDGYKLVPLKVPAQ